MAGCLRIYQNLEANASEPIYSQPNRNRKGKRPTWSPTNLAAWTSCCNPLLLGSSGTGDPTQLAFVRRAEGGGGARLQRGALQLLGIGDGEGEPAPVLCIKEPSGWLPSEVWSWKPKLHVMEGWKGMEPNKYVLKHTEAGCVCNKSGFLHTITGAVKKHMVQIKTKGILIRELSSKLFKSQMNQLCPRGAGAKV